MKTKNNIIIALLTICSSGVFGQYTFDDKVISKNDIKSSTLSAYNYNNDKVLNSSEILFTFLDNGKVSKKVIRDSFIYQYKYDVNDNLIFKRYTFLTDKTYVSNYYYIYDNGKKIADQVKHYLDTLRIIKLYKYDDKGRLFESYTENWCPTSVNRYEYNNKNQLIYKTILHTSTDYQKIYSQFNCIYKYDDKGRCTKKIIKKRYSNHKSTIKYKYNTDGRLKECKFTYREFPDMELYSDSKHLIPFAKIKQVYEYFPSGLTRSIKEYVNKKLTAEWIFKYNVE